MKRTPAVALDLPVKPISVNALYKGKRYKSEEYKNFESELAYNLPLDARIGLEGPLVLEATFYITNMRQDLDNLLKGLLDVLEHCGVYSNDKQIVAIRATKEKAKEPRIKVKLYAET